MQTVVGYRMDRRGAVFVRYLGGAERQATVEQAREILRENPEIYLTVSSAG